MTSLVTAALVIFTGAAILSGPVMAQDTPPPAAAPTVKVPVGPYDFEVDGNEPLTACVVERRESLAGTFVSLQVLVRLESGDIVPLSAYTTRSTAVLADAHVDDCFTLGEGS